MRRVATAGAVCVALALGTAPAQAHGGPSGGGSQYPHWYTASGARMPAELIESRAADAPCGTHITLLTIVNVEGDSARTYIRDPDRQIGESSLAGTYAARAETPYDAVETGLHQDGKELLLAQDAAFAYLVGEDGVERWPALTKLGLTCD